MKQLYIGWSVFVILFQILLIALASKKKEKLSKNVIWLCSFFLLSTATAILPLFIHNTTIVRTLFGLYYILDLCLLHEFFRYILLFTRSPMDTKKYAFNNFLYYALSSIDTIAIIVNSITGTIFTVTPVFFTDGSIYFWQANFSVFFRYHIALTIAMLLHNLLNLLKRVGRGPKFMGPKMIILGFLLLLLALAKEVFRNNDFPHDIIAEALYICISAVIFYNSFYGLYASVTNSMLSLVSENINYAVVFFDIKGKCFYMNRNAREIFGEGKNGTISAEGYKEKLKRNNGGEVHEPIYLTQSLTLGEKEHKYSCEYKIIRDKRRRKTLSYIKLEDITDELERLEQEKYRTEHDPLTGLYNRAAFFSYAKETLLKNPDEVFLMVATNIMDFKVVNSLFGEHVGDELLKLQARRFSSTPHTNQVCGRISGDKFAMLIQKSDFNIEEFLNINSAMQQTLQKYNYKIQNYIGVYEISDHSENTKTMFDKAMLTIQNIRGNMEQTIAFYDMPLMEKKLREKRIVTEFDSALANGEFTMYLHPQVKADDSRVMGAEALVRWITPDDGVIPPMDFIPMLEQSGMIHKLDQYIWELAVKKLAEWKAIGNEMYISINISPKDFYYCDVYKFLTTLVEKYHVSPQKLNIEITETVFVQNVEAHRNILQKLRSYGFTIEMDDFGSGYSSLNTLKSLEMNILKIDMEFLRDWDKNKKNREIINSIVAMSKALGMTVVSEGVETEDQAEFLKEIGCDIFQGFFFSKPIPPEEFEKRYVDVKV